MKSALCLLVCSLVATSLSQTVGKCGREQSRAFDTCANKLFIIGDKDARFPTNLGEANQWCREARSSIKCIRDFSKNCLSSLTRQVNNLLAYGANKHQRKVCKNIQTRTEAYENLRCLNKNYAYINEQMVTLVDHYQKAIGTKATQRIPALCCKFTEFRQRAYAQASKVCNLSETEYFDNFISAFASDIMDLLCTNYGPGSERCQNIELPDTDMKKQRCKSPMPPLLVAMSTL